MSDKWDSFGRRSVQLFVPVLFMVVVCSVSDVHCPERGPVDVFSSARILNEHTKTRLNRMMRSSAEFRVTMTRFFTMCEMESSILDHSQSDFTCWYHFGSLRPHHWLTIQPMKAELLSTDPEIVLFRDVIRDRQIRIIKNMAAAQFHWSTIGSDDPNEIEVRRSETAWFFNHHDHPTLVSLGRTVEAITGLSYEAAEPTQVLRYRQSGYYFPHVDSANSNNNWTRIMGQRAATFFLYMSDDHHGGGTAFPRAGLYIRPIKGAAAFWYNSDATSKLDGNTLHGACPVTMGTKWSANYWIREMNSNHFAGLCRPGTPPTHHHASPGTPPTHHHGSPGTPPTHHHASPGTPSTHRLPQ